MDQFKHYLLLQKEIAEANLGIINRFLSRAESKREIRTSNIEIARNVLNAAAKPLHVSEIVSNAKRDFNVELERDSIVSAIVKKVKVGKTFIRTAPNTFALKERLADKTNHGGRK